MFSVGLGSLLTIGAAMVVLLSLGTVITSPESSQVQKILIVTLFLIPILGAYTLLFRKIRASKGGGGEYFPWLKLLSVNRGNITQEDWESQVVHEFCHRVEHTIPAIFRLECEYYDSRQQRHSPLRLWYPQNVKQPQAGMYEILTTGYQAIMFGYRDKHDTWDEELDPEHRDFVLGIVACC